MPGVERCGTRVGQNLIRSGMGAQSYESKSNALPAAGKAGDAERLWTALKKDFEIFLRVENRMSSNSVEAYMHDVSLLADYAIARQIAPTQVTTRDIETLLRELGEDDALGPRSQARLLSGVRKFFHYLTFIDAVGDDPTSLIDPPKLGQHLPEVLSVEEVNAMEAAIDLSSPLGHRNLAIVEVLFSCGLRVSELCALRMSRIFWQEGFIRVIGKGNKERLVPIGDVALHDIQNYLTQRRGWRKVPANEDTLFVSQQGKPISRVMVFYIVRDLVAKAGIRKPVSPHTLRHSLATELVRGGADLRVVQAMLGHESIVTTEMYTHLSREHLREALMKYHPRGERK